MVTTKNSSRRLRNRSVRSISVKFLNSVWWLTQMIPMVEKLTAHWPAFAAYAVSCPARLG
jgi:hypothetical protein